MDRTKEDIRKEWEEGILTKREAYFQLYCINPLCAIEFWREEFPGVDFPSV